MSEHISRACRSAELAEFVCAQRGRIVLHTGCWQQHAQGCAGALQELTKNRGEFQEKTL